MRVCAQHGQAATALSLYDWMRTPREEGGAGLTPTVFTYTAAMRAALTGSLMERALAVWEDALAARCEVDCRLCTTLIEVCGRKGDTDRALEAYAQVGAAPVDACVCVLFMGAAQHAHVLRMPCAGTCAWPLLGVHPRLRGPPPSPTTTPAPLQMRDAPKESRMAPSVHAYTAAMRAASEGGRWEAALAIWEDMQKAGCKPTGARLHRAARRAAPPMLHAPGWRAGLPGACLPWMAVLSWWRQPDAYAACLEFMQPRLRNPFPHPRPQTSHPTPNSYP
jgi:pentatricopeptide repeat protein